MQAPQWHAAPCTPTVRALWNMNTTLGLRRGKGSRVPQEEPSLRHARSKIPAAPSQSPRLWGWSKSHSKPSFCVVTSPLGALSWWLLNQNHIQPPVSSNVPHIYRAKRSLVPITNDNAPPLYSSSRQRRHFLYGDFTIKLILAMIFHPSSPLLCYRELRGKDKNVQQDSYWVVFSHSRRSRNFIFLHCLLPTSQIGVIVSFPPNFKFIIKLISYQISQCWKILKIILIQIKCDHQCDLIIVLSQGNSSTKNLKWRWKRPFF